MKKVAVIMGSDSDLPVLKGAFDMLKKLSIPYEAHVYSAHRTPAEAAAFAAADIDGNGKLDSTDVYYMMKYCAEKGAGLNPSWGD